MNKSKFSLADLMTVLSTVTFGFFCFLSLNFLSLGETVPSIMWSAVIALILGGLAFGAKLLKKTSINFKTCIISEGIFLLLFAIIAILAIVPFSHYFSVSTKKEDIQQKLSANISKADSLFTKYESLANSRLFFYKATLSSVVNNKGGAPNKYHLQFGFVDGIDDKIQIDHKVLILKTKLYPPNYQNMKQVDSTWLSNAKNTIEEWRPIGVVNLVNTIETNVTSWKNILIQNYSFKVDGASGDFDYPVSFQNTRDEFVSKSSPTMLSVLYAIGLYLLMLMSYFITKRHTRYPGLKVIFGTSETQENEL